MIHQASHISSSGGNGTTNSVIVKNIKHLELIKLKNIRGGLPVNVVASESQLCQKFWSGQYSDNISQSILG